MICIIVFITNEIQKSVNMYKIMEKKSMSDNNTNNHQNDVHLMTTHRMNYANSVRKANNIIEGKYTMNQPESKIMETVLSIMDASNLDLNYIEIETKKLCDFAHVNLRELKDFTLQMVKREIVFTGRDANGFIKEIQTTWLDSAVYYPERGIVRLRISEELKPYLLGMWRSHIPYTEFCVGELISVTYYTKRIYEIACQYKNIGHRPKMTIYELRSMLGIPKEKYPRFANFRERVLDAAIASIESNKDMPYNVSYELYRTGRAFTEIAFFVKKKMDGAITEREKRNPPNPATVLIEQYKETMQPINVSKMKDRDLKSYLLKASYPITLIESLTEDQQRYIVRLLENGINPVVLKDYLIDKGFRYIQQNNEIALERMKKNGKNYGALFFAAVKNNYAGTQQKSVKAQNQIEIAHHMTADELKKQFEEADKMRDEYKEKDEKTISGFKRKMMNDAISKYGTVHHGVAEVIFNGLKANPNPRIQQALKIYESGNALPPGFFPEE